MATMCDSLIIGGHMSLDEATALASGADGITPCSEWVPGYSLPGAPLVDDILHNPVGGQGKAKYASARSVAHICRRRDV